MIKVSDLRINPDKISEINSETMEKLKGIILKDKKFMKLKPIKVDMSQNGLILSGTLRFKAIQLLGMTEIPESWVEDFSKFTDGEKQKYIDIYNSPRGDAYQDIRHANEWDMHWEEKLKKIAFGDKKMNKNKEKQAQKMIKVSDLRVNPDNPRTITKENVEKLKKSISELPKLMELRPIVADMSQDGLVLGGNQRLQAIKLLEITEIPETWVIDASHLTDEEKQKFIIADNASFGDWDWDILANQWNENLLKDFGLDVPSFEIPDESIGVGKQKNDTVCVCPQCGEMFDYTKNKKTE